MMLMALFASLAVDPPAEEEAAPPQPVPQITTRDIEPPRPPRLSAPPPPVLVQRPLPTPPMPTSDPIRLFDADSYPRDAAANDDVGRTDTDLFIDEEGMPIACLVRASSGSASLDATTCDILMRNMRFEPATIYGGGVGKGMWDAPAIAWRLQGYNREGPSSSDRRFRERMAEAGFSDGDEMVFDRLAEQSRLACTVTRDGEEPRDCNNDEKQMARWAWMEEFSRRVGTGPYRMAMGRQKVDSVELPILWDAESERLHQYDHVFRFMENGVAGCFVPWRRGDRPLIGLKQWGSRLCEEDDVIIFAKELDLSKADAGYEFRYFLIASTSSPE
ncbi:energy transducer TonB [Sphingomicrobium sediminis]|uniref:Energy transducer TonB n=1 Tax=Sphingomicrobium sediminis TaxID=2950949 RepID=A0A9X2EKZ8_9SPHN|nr:energy transducer TonB [Sphingomicrobium sediminis]MCM8557327.1 energy transducer TonB [Sphingomicrobium sediminis]